MAIIATPISRAETPNAVCAICLLQSRRGGPVMREAVAEVVRGPYLRYFACQVHADRAVRWGRIEVAHGKRRA